MIMGRHPYHTKCVSQLVDYFKAIKNVQKKTGNVPNLIKGEGSIPTLIKIQKF